MKQWVITALALTLGSTAPVLQADVDGATIDAVKTLWQTQHKALDAHDIDAVLATYSDADDIMLMGTGPGEHWVGRDEVADAYRRFTEGFDANTMQVDCADGAASTMGDVLWLTAVCSFSDSQGDTPRRFVANLSAVVVEQGDDWRFHTMHFSHLTGPDEAEAPASTTDSEPADD